MSAKKRFLKHPKTQYVLSWILAQYIRFVYYTSRKTRHIDPAALPYLRGEENAIFAFWHGRMMMCPTIEPPKRKMHVLISFHRDGMLISQVISHFGEATISGSSDKGGASKGGSQAVKDILRVIKKGDNVSITPDGPRGPVQVAEKGIVTVARLSGKPVLPVTFSASRHRRLKSWDRFMLALPFGRIVFCVSAPISVSRDADDHEQEQARMTIENSMNRLTDMADGMTSASFSHA